MMKRGHRTPHLWKSGPDYIDNQLYYECQRRRAQAKFRGELWLITEQEYIDLWRTDDRYINKGRSPDKLCMTLIDPTLPWTINNVMIITRSQHFKRANLKKRGVVDAMV